MNKRVFEPVGKCRFSTFGTPNNAENDVTVDHLFLLFVLIFLKLQKI